MCNLYPISLVMTLSPFQTTGDVELFVLKAGSYTVRTFIMIILAHVIKEVPVEIVV